MASSEQNSYDQPREVGQRGLSGKRVTAVVVLLLLLVGAWLSYTLWVYSQVDRARGETNIAWRNLVDRLDERYREAEKYVAKGVDARDIEMQLGEQFRLAVDRFRTTAQPSAQYITAEEIEKQLAGFKDIPEPTAELQLAVDRFNACLRQERDVLSSPGGRFLSVFLKFAEPEELRLST